jgi:prepilin-type N-terminal cleavage/methylation domain-containing protein
MRRTRLQPGRAFTMIELIVVVVILGVMAAAIVPRMFGNERRAAENEIRQVTSFLSTVASRSALSSQSLGIRYSAADGRMELYSLRARGNAGDFAAARDFLPDPVTLPVRLNHVKLSAATVGGLPVDQSQLWVEFAAGAPRPSVVMVFEFDKRAAWHVELSGDESQAVYAATELTDNATPRYSRTDDLDKKGASQTPW